jgi:hypothetical protein
MSLFSNFFRNNSARRTGAGDQSARPVPASASRIDGVKIVSYGTKGQQGSTVSNRGAADGAETPKSTLMPVATLAGAEALAFEIFGQSAFHKSRVTQGEATHWVANFRVPVPRSIIEMIWQCAEDRGGKLWPNVDIEALKLDLTRWNQAQDLLAEYSVANIGLLFRKRMDAISAAVATGGRPEPSAMLNRQDAEEQIAEYRKAVRQGLAEVSRRVYERLLPKCNRMRTAASELAILRASEERDGAEKLGLPFKASATLKALLFMAIAGSFDEVSNYFPGYVASLVPDSKFFGITVVEFEQTNFAKESERERQRIIEAADKAVAENKIRIARKQQGDFVAMDESRRAEVLKINDLHDKLRAENESNLKERVKNRPVQEVRVIQ